MTTQTYTYNNLKAVGNTSGRYQTTTLVTNFSSVGSGFVLQDLTSTIAEGVDTQQRLSRTIRVRGVALEGILHGGQSNLNVDDNSDVVRICLFWANDSFVVGNLSGYGVSVPLDERVVVGMIGPPLLDTLVPLQVYGKDSVGYIPAVARLSITKGLGQKVVFRASGATTNISRRLILACVSNSSAPPNPGFVAGWVRLNFDSNLA